MMALDTDHATSTAASTGAAASTGKGDVDAGRKLYSQVCATCHGADGNAVVDHKLSMVNARLSHAAVAAFLRNPKPPMPKMYPNLLNDQNIADVTAYLYDQIIH